MRTASDSSSAPSAPASGSGPWHDVDRHPLGWAVLAITFVAMLAFTWRTWPDAIVDFGRELYVPWRLAEGQRLYTEIAYHSGPLSPHVNALAFTILGVGLTTLWWINAAVLIGVVALLRSLLRELGAAPGAATVGGVTFLVLFAFGQFVGLGNYNWMSPYSHELTHGTALALLALWFVVRFARSTGDGRGPALGAGLAIGLTFLTKAEVFVALTGAAATGFVLALRTRRAARRPSGRALGVLLAGAVVPPLVTCALLAATRPIGDALVGTLGTWSFVADSGVGSGGFFGKISGLDDASTNLGRLATWAGAWLAAVGVLAALGRLVPAKVRAVAGLAIGAGFVAGAVVLDTSFPVQHWLRPLPVALAVAAVLAARRAWPATAPDTAPTHVARVAMIVFAGLLLLKVALRVRVGHYGFVLAMPGAVLLATWLTGALPRLVTRAGASASPVRLAAFGLWAAILFGHVVYEAGILSVKTHPVGNGPDHFLTDLRGRYVQEAVEWLERRTAPHETMTVFIDCELLNYLTRMPNPIRYGNFNPHQVELFGEDAMIAALDANPPDLIALVDRDTSEYGPRYFSQDYGVDLASWIGRHYALTTEPIGGAPFVDGQFGIALMRRTR